MQELPKNGFYRPRAAEIEFTNKCNLGCAGCAIRNNVCSKDPKKLSFEKVISALNELEELGVSFYSLTGGEPFTDLDYLCAVIKSAAIPIYKIQTNGKAFSSEEKTIEILARLRDAGFIRPNTSIKPSVNVSIGMQTVEGVPLSQIAMFTNIFIGFFGDSADLTLNVTPLPGQDIEGLLSALNNEYRKLTGQDYPFSRVAGVITCMQYTNGNGGHFLKHERQSTVEDYLSGKEADFTCMNFHLEKNNLITPRILIRADGTVYPCPGFSHIRPAGNIHSQTMAEIVDAINKDADLETICADGFKSFCEKRLEDNPAILGVKLPPSPWTCEICAKLRRNSDAHEEDKTRLIQAAN